ncbi:MAG: hypothetical protein HOV81_37910 [Kofleriaceae bacterium]|nr:hypothetical protein [Kofleriaceae bacterium]
MKAFALAIVLVLGVACGSKKKEGGADVDRYINTDLAPYLARALAARAGYADITAEDFEKRPSRTKYRIRDAALPLLTEAVEGASKLTPPPAAKQLHDDFVATVKAERDAIAEMAAAFDPPDPDKFRRGHAKMMDAQASVMRWERKLDETLASHGLKLRPLPDVKIPEAKADEPVADGSGGSAAAPKVHGMCKADSEKAAPDGSVTCATEYVFAPPETVAGTPKESVVLCGPGGPLTYGPDGVLSGCQLESNLVIGTETIPKGSRVVLGAQARVTKAVLPNGNGICFDERLKSKPC